MGLLILPPELTLHTLPRARKVGEGQPQRICHMTGSWGRRRDCTSFLSDLEHLNPHLWGNCTYTGCFPHLTKQRSLASSGGIMLREKRAGEVSCFSESSAVSEKPQIGGPRQKCAQLSTASSPEPPHHHPSCHSWGWHIRIGGSQGLQTNSWNLSLLLAFLFWREHWNVMSNSDDVMWANYTNL